MATMLKSCRICSQPFPIADFDRQFYQKVQVSEPTLCPLCRMRQRLSFRNERNLYKRQCDLCRKEIVSIYRSESGYTVYCLSCWWSDKWDALSYGRDFDFNEPFFPQFAELKKAVPHLALHVINNENSDYVNLTGYCRNCYLIFAAEYDEDCLYGTQVIKSKNCVDTLMCFNSQYCYEVIDVDQCYELFFSRNVQNCHTSMFLFDCRGCSNCLFSSNLRNKQYYIFNQPHTKEDYEKKRQEIMRMLNAGRRGALEEQFIELCQQSIHKDFEIINCEESFGNYLVNCKNAHSCFDMVESQDCAYVNTAFHVKDLVDVSHTTDAELIYESTSAGFSSYNVRFANGAFSTKNATYVDNIHFSDDIFGCVGLHHKRSAIFNKLYSKEEYEALSQRIIEHMKKTKEWGEFFPPFVSPFCYNETVAYEHFPLVKEEAVALQYQWKEKDTREFQPQTYRVLSDIREVPDSITQEILACVCQICQFHDNKLCGKNYRIVAPELSFYRQMGLPVPDLCPDCRYRNRMRIRNPRRLWERNCAKCGSAIHTAYSPERREKIYCQTCYLEAVV